MQNRTNEEAAAFLRLKPATLSQWRWQGRGPRYRKVGGRVIYTDEDLESFLADAARTSTSDPGPSKHDDAAARLIGGSR